MYSRTIPPCSRYGAQSGYSLLELTLVVLMLGIMAAAVVPSFFSADPTTLDTAAEEFAAAMRYARTEAMRLGEPRGFRTQVSQKRIRVFRPDTGVVPWTRIYDVYHPISKKLYDIQLDNHSFAAADNIATNLVYRGVCNQPGSVQFDGNGFPRCNDPATVTLDRFELTFTLGSESRLVSLNGVTGEVSVE